MRYQGSRDPFKAKNMYFHTCTYWLMPCSTLHCQLAWDIQNKRHSIGLISQTCLVAPLRNVWIKGYGQIIMNFK